MRNEQDKGKPILMRPQDFILRPSCLLGPQCWLSRTESAAFHRRLIFRAWPSQARWRWALLLTANILSWYLFSGWVSLWQGLQRLRALSAQLGKKIRGVQLLDLLFLTLVTGAPSQDYFRYKLSEHRRVDWLDFVFSPEQLTWHRVFSCPKDSHTSRLLKDKLQFERFLQEREIPSTQTLFQITSADQGLESLFSDYLPLFIKPRSANALRGCVHLSRQPADRLRGQDLGGKTIDIQGKPEIEAFIRNMVEDQPFLVQQLLSNSPEMSNYCGTEDLVTVRLTTAYNGQEVFPVYGLLEIPISADRGWELYALDLENGQPVIASGKQSLDRIRSFNGAIPGFAQLLPMLMPLHSILHDAASIGWDLCHTGQGWTLIEGNTGWNLGIPQAVSSKALLTTRLPEAYSALSRWEKSLGKSLKNSDIDVECKAPRNENSRHIR